MEKSNKKIFHSKILISTKLPNPILKTRVSKLVFITIPCHKFWPLKNFGCTYFEGGLHIKNSWFQHNIWCNILKGVYTSETADFNITFDVIFWRGFKHQKQLISTQHLMFIFWRGFTHQKQLISTQHLMYIFWRGFTH